MAIDEQRWEDANAAEKRSWDVVLNDPQLIEATDIYKRHAPIMGLYDGLDGKPLRVIDIGGGPMSMMLHFPNIYGTVVDPIAFGQIWIDRYKEYDIDYVQMKAEDFLRDFSGEKYDEVWMYNCLQHVQDPEFILKNLYKVAPILRISEPCNTLVDLWHPHTFTPEWYYHKLEEISFSFSWNKIDYDYPYVGGVCILK